MEKCSQGRVLKERDVNTNGMTESNRLLHAPLRSETALCSPESDSCPQHFQPQDDQVPVTEKGNTTSKSALKPPQCGSLPSFSCNTGDTGGGTRRLSFVACRGDKHAAMKPWRTGMIQGCKHFTEMTSFTFCHSLMVKRIRLLKDDVRP